ncbi:MAG TPA: helix-turn-helix domain-containing protein [Burkholderiales bacterium]|nr:helix-turn-helix domain-containing protein [Burkholderiales bacterium]
MKQSIHSVADLGIVLRAVRKASRVRQDDLAATAGVSKQFTADVERGKPTVQMGLVFKLLKEMGIGLSVDIPDAVAPVLHKLQSKQRSTRTT